MVSRRRFSQRFAGLVFVAALGSQAHAIIGGVADTSDSVYQYMGRMSNGLAATPIGSNWLVTATHVTTDIVPGSSTYTNGDGTFTITQVVTVPSGFGGSSDISLVQVSGSMTHFFNYGGVTPPTVAGVNGPTVTLVGYGDHSSGIGVQPGYNGVTRYLATNTIDSYTMLGNSDTDPNRYLAYTYDLDDGTAAHNIMGSQFGTSREGGIASQDSGGGWFVNSGGAMPTIVAVSDGVNPMSVYNSSGSTNYWDAGGAGYGADLAYYSAFIQQTTRIAPVPEPATLAALGLGTLGILRRRRRN